MVLSLWFEKNDSHVVGWRGCCLVVVVVMVCANTPATPPPHKKTTPAPSPQVLYIGHDVETQCSSCARCAYVCSCLLCVWPHNSRQASSAMLCCPSSFPALARACVCVPTNRVPLQTALKRRANVSSCASECLQRANKHHHTSQPFVWHMMWSCHATTIRSKAAC